MEGYALSYKNEAYFKDVLINEVFYVANKNKKLVRLNSNNQDYVGVWTQEGQAEDYLKHASIDYDRVLKLILIHSLHMNWMTYLMRMIKLSLIKYHKKLVKL